MGNDQSTSGATWAGDDQVGNVRWTGTAENDSVDIYVLNNDWDADGDSLTILDRDPTPLHGTAEISAGGDYITYTPNSGFYGWDEFQYTIDDGDSQTPTATATVTISGYRTLSDYGAGVARAVKAALTHTAFDVELTPSDPGVILSTDPEVVTNVLPDDWVNFDVTFTGDGYGHTFDLLFVRAGSNVILGSIPVVIEALYRYDTDAIDPDNDPIKYSLGDDAPAGMEINEDTGVITWAPPTPPDSNPVPYSFTVFAKDNRGGSDDQLVQIQVTDGSDGNVAPIIDDIVPTDAAVGRYYEYQVQLRDWQGNPIGNHDEDRDPVRFYLQPHPGAQLPQSMAIDSSSGLITWTPVTPDPAWLTIRALDGRGNEATMPLRIGPVGSENVDITVHDSLTNIDPVLAAIDDQTAVVGHEFSCQAAATDLDLDPLHFDLPLKPIGMAIHRDKGIIVWTPTAKQAGEHDVLVRVRDGQGGVALEWFKVTVAKTNTPPQIVSAAPDGPAVPGRTYQYEVQVQDANDLLTSLVFSADLVSHGKGIEFLDDTGKKHILQWTPEDGHENLTHTVTITVTDPYGATDTETFDLRVVPKPANEAPTILTAALPGPAAPGVPYQARIEATDPDGDVLTFFLDDGHEGMTIDPATGMLSWSQTPSEDEPYDLTASVSDGRGFRVAKQFSILVDHAQENSGPMISPTSLPGPAAVSYPYQVQLDASDPDGDKLAFSVTVTDSLEEPVTLGPDEGVDGAGLFRWTPTQEDTYHLDFLVEDGRGGSGDFDGDLTVDSDPAAGNIAPSISTTTIPGPAGVGILYRARIAATDDNGDPLEYALDSTSADKGMWMDGELLKWIPDADDLTDHTIYVTVRDGRGGETTTGPLSLTVLEGLNEPPEVVSTPRSRIHAGQTYRYVVEATDPNDDALTFTLFAHTEDDPAKVDFDPLTRLLEWTTAADDIGQPHSFTLKIADGMEYTLHTFDVEAVSADVNEDPQIVSAPALYATLDKLYRCGSARPTTARKSTRSRTSRSPPDRPSTTTPSRAIPTRTRSPSPCRANLPAWRSVSGTAGSPGPPRSTTSRPATRATPSWWPSAMAAGARPPRTSSSRWSPTSSRRRSTSGSPRARWSSWASRSPSWCRSSTTSASSRSS